MERQTVIITSMTHAVGPLSAAGISASASASVTVPATERYRSPLRYPGGKHKAIEQISKIFPKSAEEYREPLVGGGSVYFHARTVSFAKKYWINDKFEELISFWKAVQDPAMCKKLQQELELL